MTAQELLAYGIGVAAIAYLLWRRYRRRATGNCCGEPECPAAKAAVRKFSAPDRG